jgi:hypothetical protein
MSSVLLIAFKVHKRAREKPSAQQYPHTNVSVYAHTLHARTEAWVHLKSPAVEVMCVVRTVPVPHLSHISMRSGVQGSPVVTSAFGGRSLTLCRLNIKIP